MKIIFDKIGACCLIIISAPILIISILILAFNHKFKVFYTQERPGYLGKPFKMIKLKTMKDIESCNLKLTDKERITKIGALLRKYSIDELPQLFNILKGDMSLIGPRPLLKEYMHLYSHEQKKRHLVKPGITGYAQVNGRNAISWEEKFELDLFYVNNVSFLLDLKIIIYTIVKIMKAEGINKNTYLTMDKYNGIKNIHKVE